MPSQSQMQIAISFCNNYGISNRDDVSNVFALDVMAEREGFEPSIRFWRILTFQASAFDHSATAPHALEAGHLERCWAQGKLPGDGLDFRRQRHILRRHPTVAVRGQ